MNDPIIYWSRVGIAELNVILSNLPHEQTGSGVKAEIFRLLFDEENDPPMFRVKLLGVSGYDLTRIERAVDKWRSQCRVLESRAANPGGTDGARN